MSTACWGYTGIGKSILALRNGLRVKVAAMTATTHNPSEEPCWVSCLRENFMSSSYGGELETGPAARFGTAPVPHPTVVLQVDQAASADQGKMLSRRRYGSQSRSTCWSLSSRSGSSSPPATMKSYRSSASPCSRRRMPIDQLLSLQPIVVTKAVSPNQLTCSINVGTLLMANTKAVVLGIATYRGRCFIRIAWFAT